jgi:hypothetical protein
MEGPLIERLREAILSGCDEKSFVGQVNTGEQREVEVER